MIFYFLDVMKEMYMYLFDLSRINENFSSVLRI